MKKRTEKRFREDLEREAAILAAQRRLFDVLRGLSDEQARRVLRAYMALKGIDR